MKNPDSGKVCLFSSPDPLHSNKTGTPFLARPEDFGTLLISLACAGTL
jgi:hypothetical protein